MLCLLSRYTPITNQSIIPSYQSCGLGADINLIREREMVAPRPKTASPVGPGVKPVTLTSSIFFLRPIHPVQPPVSRVRHHGHQAPLCHPRNLCRTRAVSSLHSHAGQHYSHDPALPHRQPTTTTSPSDDPSKSTRFARAPRAHVHDCSPLQMIPHASAITSADACSGRLPSAPILHLCPSYLMYLPI
jgi:hypothetical protein